MKMPAVIAAPARPLRPSLDRLLVSSAAALLFPALQLLDAVTTLFNYSEARLREANPITSAYIARYGLFAYLVAKLVYSVFLVATVALSVYFARRLRRPWLRVVGYTVFALACLWTLVAVGTNLYYLHQVSAF